MKGAGAMFLGQVVEAVGREPAVARMAKRVWERPGVDLAITVSSGLRAPLLAACATRRTGNLPADTPPVILAITPTTRAAQELTASLGSLLSPERVDDFPSWETLPHERLSPRSDTVGRRLAVLRRLVHPDADHPGYGPLDVVVAPVRAVLQPIVKGLGDRPPLVLCTGTERDLHSVVADLTESGYTRVDMVERRGEFAVRGGIVDLFPPTEQHPLRVEFWGDTVEEVRWFRVADQRSLEVSEHGVWAPACRELLLTDQVRARADKLSNDLPGVADLLHKMSQGIAVEGMESFAPALADGMESLLDVLPAGSLVVSVDPERIRTRAHDLVATSAEFLDASWANAVAGNKVPVDLRELMGQASYFTLDHLAHIADELALPWWALTPFAQDADTVSVPTTAGASGGDSGAGGKAVEPRNGHATGGIADHPRVLEPVNVPSRDIDPMRGDTGRIVEVVRGHLDARHTVVVVTEGHGLASRISEVFAENDIPARLQAESGDGRDLDGAAPGSGAGLDPAVVTITTGTLGRGFELPTAGLVVLTDADLFGASDTGPSTKDMRRMPSRARRLVDPLSLNPGDFVVHEQHGVGRFVEMTRRTVGGATREYLLLEYASSKRGQPGDRLFVPTDQLDQVTRYVGGAEPTLHRLGGSDWAKTKSRARKHVRQIAGELIRLYSARQATKGYAFGPDTPWQTELEDAFAYVETPDQLATIDEVKEDMRREIPMDRLICGDVGYGKTEIAVRAAFKAIQDGKQVAVLVPTTLLVQQHLNTFADRYAQFPVTVKALSRFQTDKEAAAVLEGLADGGIDLVIGTHRLLGSQVRFKDLGLVVIDEEQRFGVEHKEQLKAMRTAVDVLAMSATPIPRTLEMALTGIREMSTLATPPEERHPVLTFVGPYEEKQIAAAIRRELMREGQVFFVHNTVRSIERVAARIRELVPEARVVTAHGQMSENRLEQVVVDYWEKRSDVLVCTTIIETGLDISNANTLIVDRADKLGLSQLHQLRGRVGRGRERAYSYFLYPPETPMTETAHDRLATIAANTDLGAGMQVAMKDLEIRGAGNLLGGEQSGHIEGVGFDLYVRLVGEAVAEFRDGGPAETAPAEVRLELPVTAHLPHDYVPGERLRLDAYRRLAAAAAEEDIQDIEAELLDRFGTPPEPVQQLGEVARLRILARLAGVGDIAVQGNHVRLAPVDLPESRRLRLLRLYPGTIVKPAVRTILVPVPKTERVGGLPLRDAAVMAWVATLLRSVFLDDISAAATSAKGASA